MAATLLFLSTLLSTLVASSAFSERETLIQFKNSIVDPTKALSDWSNTTSIHHCSWTGVSCTNPFLVSSINLQSLNLSGEISSSLCNLVNLTHLNLADNFFNQPIPLHLSECVSLVTLNLSNNLIWGTLPDQISQFKKMEFLDFSRNHVEGKIPDSIGSLHHLKVLNFGSNLLSGEISPGVFGNFTELVVLDLSHNPFLVSEIPADFGKLSKLEQLLLQSSGFYGEIPGFFNGLKSLKILDLSQNNLTGSLPRIELLLSSSPRNLVSFDVSQNKLSGPFPNGVCESKSLVHLSLHTNFFNGSISNEFIVKCTNLEKFEVQNNGFSGKFPSWLWSLPKIKLIRGENNRFTGEIPDSISEAAQLEHVQIDNNSFTTKFPLGVGKLRSLYRLSASLNGLYGELPPNFCDSPVMSIIDFSHNFLSGNIPEMKNCRKLVSLSLANNRNPDLCGPGLPNSCLNDSSASKSFSFAKLTFALVFIAIAFAIFVFAFGFYMIRSYKKSRLGLWRSVFFYPLRVTEQELLMSMDEKSVRGNGGNFGRVYVVNLPSGEFVVVKKILNFSYQSSKALKNEVKTLAKIRHKNVVKIMGFCHSDDSIFMIYEYLPKGSLGDFLGKPDFDFSWSLRLKIAIGIARGLAYLHRDYLPHLLNRNLKSNNILLDADFEPKLTDFALDRIIGENTFQSIISSQSTSSCYLAPEYGHMKKATEQNDTYSFGVVLLELLTGRKAEENKSGGAPLDVVKWVRRKINITDGASRVLDPKVSSLFRQQMLDALEIALRCTSVVPEKRPSMYEVVRSLQSLEIM
ncbi:hypothetical protein MIMGU_mgv1a001546mg [Erythranthe guttata]|uniref:Protein kinase domain-containing protein n=1 Tax=Erythranthe guttata TaxID=4155 RepID=A0A022RHK7_ERYGU|nr:hypothetical protein MIMGU_mgv1a001546mg [Erythranthe guttata]